MNKKRVICDCDNTGSFPGRPMDDTLAILYLLGNPEDIELLGITCNYGNGTSQESFISNTTLLNEIGYTDIPVLRGFEAGQFIGSLTAAESFAHEKTVIQQKYDKLCEEFDELQENYNELCEDYYEA